jgi:selenophosphate synthase
MDIKAIKSAIMFNGMSNADLDEIVQAVRYARAQAAKVNIRSFWNGDQVKFVNPKTGRSHVGVVTKVKIKNISVREGSVVWNVPANMLEAV